MDKTLQPSNAADLGAAWEIVALPVTQTADDSPFYIRLVSPPLEAVLKYFQGVPIVGGLEAPAEKEPGLSAMDRLRRVVEQTLETSEQLEAQARAFFGELGAASEPPISFDQPQPGAIHWPQVHFQNRLFLVRELARLAGAGPSRLDNLGSFRLGDGGEGRAVRASDDGALPLATLAP